MDVLTQGLLGGVVAQCFAKKEDIRRASWVGALAGMAPDLDVLIRSNENPILSIIYHRHFTHALSFVPIGATLVALFFWLFYRFKLPFKKLWWPAFLGYATHGILDAFTSYGTMLWWPFSQDRIAWDLISIIDPVFTLILIFGFLLAIIFRVHRPSWVAFLFITCYLGFGYYQHLNALKIQKTIAQQRGHSWVRGRTMPTLGNLLVWRSVYEANGRFYVDAFRTFPGAVTQVWEGGSLSKFKPENLGVTISPKLQEDLKTYSWFADHYLARLREDKNIVGDLRYSFRPQGLKPIWGVELPNPISNRYLRKLYFRRVKELNWSLFWEMISGNDLEAKTLEAMGARPASQFPSAFP